jgi:transposase
LIGALLKGRLIAPMLFEGTCNTKTFNAWLNTFLAPHLRKGMTVILDNATFHKSAKTREILTKADCRVLFLPPYSPHLNPIEKTWATLERYRKYHAHLTLDQLVRSVG